MPRFTAIRPALTAPFLAAALALAALGAQAQTTNTHCEQESRATCQKETAAAKNAARQGQLTPAHAGAATQRCNVFKDDTDRQACVARVRDGAVSGSVNGGGILRESTITMPAATK